MTIVADHSQAWIRDVCRQFSDAVGWELAFLPVEAGRAGEVEAELRADPDTCWFVEITDGQERIGFLRMVLPVSERSDRAFSTVGDLADAFGRLISRTASAARLAESRTDDLTTLVDIGRSVPTEENVSRSLDRLLHAAIQLTSFRSAAFFLLDPSTERLKLRGTAQRESAVIPLPSRRLAENPPDLEALARGRSVLGIEAAMRSGAWLPPGTATAVCLAVGSEAGPLGTLWVYDRRSREPSDRELHVLESIAVQIAAVLERIVLLRESAAQLRLQRDLQLASQCQTFDGVTSLSPTSAIEAAIRSNSRFEIGGDLCELVSIDADRTALSIGDASGHGVSAAIVMSSVRGAVRALALDPRSTLSAGEVLERVNRALHSITPAHQFMSLLYGVINTRQKVFTYSNAGHPSPILLRDGEPITLDSHGMLLGVVAEGAYGESTLPIGAGDTLIAFTDGVSEAMNGKRKMFRSDGIIDVLRQHSGDAPQVALEAIWSQLESHLDGTTGHDDRSLMVIRIR